MTELKECAIKWINNNLEKASTQVLSTYGLKHIFEDESPYYISNKEFIEILRELNYKIVSDEGFHSVKAKHIIPKVSKMFHFMYVIKLSESDRIKVGLSSVEYTCNDKNKLLTKNTDMLYQALKTKPLKRISKHLDHYGKIDYQTSYLLVCDSREEALRLEQTVLMALHRYKIPVFGDGGTEFLSITDELETNLANLLYHLIYTINLFNVKYYIPLRFKEEKRIDILMEFPIGYFQDIYELEFRPLDITPFSKY